MRINYASLNVEEFGSVYEGMLESDPIITKQAGVYQFDFVKGSARSSSGSHYTPDELVQPLIKHSLDYIIEDRLKSSDKKSEKEKALLSINVCDIACGSGHILLNAARRIGAELAKVRTGEDQPSPAPLRLAIRDVIKSCIYGVDKNRLAVELCKVSLWLEAHNPGEPLNFLDHHIKCGDAIVGLAHKEELENGIADEAFKRMPGDDKDIRAELAKRNKREKKDRKQYHFDFGETVEGSFADISIMFDRFNRLPENTIEEIEHKRKVYVKMTSGAKWRRLKTLADIQVAQFFIPKDEANAKKIVTDEEYMDYLSGTKGVHGLKAGKAGGIAGKKRFFHWFLEFPEVFTPSPAGEGRGEGKGGFDCIVGNPPYLGGKKINKAFGPQFLNHIHSSFNKVEGQADLVTYFLRRAYSIIYNSRSLGLIVTNTISEGDTRSGGLDVILGSNGIINFAVKSVKWPGIANLFVSLICIHKKNYQDSKYLNGKKVPYINSYFDTIEEIGSPHVLHINKHRMFRGVDFGGDGFILKEGETEVLLGDSENNKKAIYKIINGSEVNNMPIQEPTRFIINFFDWSEQKAKEYTYLFKIVRERVKPYRDKVKRKSNREKWWIYAENRPGLYKKLAKIPNCFVTAFTSKYLCFSSFDTRIIFTNALNVIPIDNFWEFSILHSNIHEIWVRKYSSSLETRLRYAPSDCFETFPFPQDISNGIEVKLEHLGEEYHKFRRKLMLKMKLGLTKTYNQFHNSDLREFSNDDIATISTLKAKEFQKQYGKETVNLWKHLKKTESACTFNEAVRDILYLRELHKQMDETVLKRLLKLNHEIHEQEVKAGLHAKGKTKKKKTGSSKQIKLF